jgi:hypothetical protein
MILEEIGTEQRTIPRRSGRNLTCWWYDNIILFSQHDIWSCDSSEATYLLRPSASVHLQHLPKQRIHVQLRSSYSYHHRDGKSLIGPRPPSMAAKPWDGAKI